MSGIRIILGTSIIMVLIGYLIIQFNPGLNLKSDSVADLNMVDNFQLSDNIESENLINASSIIIEDMVLGDPNAPVTIIEYASFTCPHCKNFHEGTFKKLKKNYIDEGTVKFILRDVYFDRYGLWAAMVARCDNSEKFYGFKLEGFHFQICINKILDNYTKIRGSKPQVTSTNLLHFPIYKKQHKLT